MNSALLPIHGLRAHARALALTALLALALLLMPAAAQARTSAAVRPTIASPVGARVSGRVRFAARDFGSRARRIVFEVDSRRDWTAAAKPLRASGWLNTRRLTNGQHVLTVEVFYTHRVRIARRRITVRNRAEQGPVKRNLPQPPTTAPSTSPAPPDTAALSEPWQPIGPSGVFTPLSDAAAASEVVSAPETRPTNTAANQYVPTSDQLEAFRSALDPWGRTPVQANPYYADVTGDYTGTTDEVIEWAAAKWGIPADWLRAEYMQESQWCSNMLGDLATVTPAVYAEYPSQARVAGTDEVYESMGISQIKWTPDGSVGAGTEPLRWESTAFNVDYQAANLRFYYDDPGGVRASWRDASYQSGQTWNSVGGWYNPYPWGNAGQESYVAQVQQQLVNRSWTLPSSKPACT